jgi:hypothetical protein
MPGVLPPVRPGRRDGGVASEAVAMVIPRVSNPFPSRDNPARGAGFRRDLILSEQTVSSPHGRLADRLPSNTTLQMGGHRANGPAPAPGGWS